MAATSIDTNKVSTYAVQDYSLAYNSCSNSISKCSELYSLLPNDFPQKATVGSIVNNLSTLKSDINSNKEVILSKIKYILSTESNSKSSALLMGKSAEELELEEELRTYGFTEPDIERIMNGEITPEDLKKEIDNDKDPSRRRYMLEAQMLNNSQVSATNMEELKILQEVTKNELEKLIAKKQHSKLETLEIPKLLNIIERIQNGEDLEYVINSEIIAWKYVNEEGEECYKYTDPYTTGYDGSITYEPITYNQMFKDSKYLEELRTITKEVEVNRMLVSSTPKELIDFLEKLNNENANINTAMEELDKSIEEKNMELNTYLYLENYITEEVDNYINNIDPYVRNENFEKNSVMNEKEVLDTLNKIDQRYTEGLELLGSTYACVVGDNKEELMQLFSYIINGKNEKGDIGNLYIPSSDRKIAVYYNDPIIANFQKWQSHMSEDEIKVFNYIYNTQSADEAYAYLENISKTLDSRWVVAKTREDQEYATEHPVAASIASIFITPVEGIFAGISSLNYKIHGGELYRSDVYSSGAVLRAAVSENIGKKTQVGKFFYDAGMSMADSLVSVGVATVTGGATISTSSMLMGTRSFVCTLNDALDRGIDTDKAILLATTSAAVEILAESYSLGHFMNLEGKMGKYVSDLTTKVAQKFNDPVMAKAASKLVYIFGGLISQGPVEAESEIATEILNNFADEVISGELSNFSLSVKNYMELGFTEEEATNMAINDNLENIVKVFLSSFLTGGVMGGASAGISSYNISRSINQEMLNQYNGNSALAFADIVSYNTNIARLEAELNKNLTKQKLREIGNKVKDFLKKNNSNGNFSIINSELDPVISDFEQAYELYFRGGLANMLVTTEKGENGKISGYSLFNSLNYAGKPTLVSNDEFQTLSSKSQYGTLVRGVSGPLAVQYASQFKTGDLYVGGANASIRGTGVYAAYGIDSTNVKQNYASNSGTTSGQVLEMTLSQDAKVIDYKTVSSEQAKVLDIMARKFTKYDSAIVDFDTLCVNLDKITDVNAKNEAKFITNVLSDIGYYAALKGYDAIVDTEKGYFNILNRSKVYVKDNGPNISNINNTIATILKVEDLDTSINMNDRYAVNINATYKGYDYVIKPKSDLKVVLNEIINNNDGSKVLIEISSINDLTLDMLENIPDNVNIRINDYNMDFYQSFRKSRQKAVEAINEYLTYTASELKLIVKELNNIKSGINESWNDYQKAKYVYDYMVNNIEYQEPLSVIGRNKHFDGLMSLVDKISTCSGFAHTYSAILNNIGIKCSTIWGNMNGVGNHAYNIVSIDGNNFIVDTTRESINQNKQGGFEGTGFGVQNVEQYVATSNVSLLENVNSTFDSISNKIDLKQDNDAAIEITGTETTEELHNKLVKLKEKNEILDLPFLEGSDPNVVLKYLEDNSSEIDILVKSKQVQEWLKKYYAKNVAILTYRVINKLSPESITVDLINEVLSLNDEQFNDFINYNAISVFYENDEIFNRAISTGNYFLYGLRDDIILKALNSDIYHEKMQNDSLLFFKTIKNIPENIVSQVNFKKFSLDEQIYFLKEYFSTHLNFDIEFQKELLENIDILSIVNELNSDDLKKFLGNISDFAFYYIISNQEKIFDHLYRDKDEMYECLIRLNGEQQIEIIEKYNLLTQKSLQIDEQHDYFNFERHLNTIFNALKPQAMEYFLNKYPQVGVVLRLNNVKYLDDMPNSKFLIDDYDAMELVLEMYDQYMSSNSTNVYGADQNAVAQFMEITTKNLDWLVDEELFKQKLMNHRGYSLEEATKFLEKIKSDPSKLKFDSRTWNLISDYISEYCIQNNRYDYNDIKNNSFTFEFNEEFKRLLTKLTNQGMPVEDAIRTLSAIDSTGVCTYAAYANEIFFAYRGKEELFYEHYGYPMFTEINGHKEFNFSELILDMYLSINSDVNGGVLFKYDDVKKGYQILDLYTPFQKYLNQDEKYINNFLKSKGLNIKFSTINTIGNEGGPSTSSLNVIKGIKKIVQNYLKSGKGSVFLSIDGGIPNKSYHFIDSNLKVYETTETWNEGGGHAVCITGVTDKYFIVSTWGIRTLIPIEDFVDNKFRFNFRYLEGVE